MSEQSNEDEIEYEVNDEFVVRSVLQKNSFNDITSEKGFEFEVTEEDEKEKEELQSKDTYWTRAEIMAHLEDNPIPDDTICKDFVNYDERVKHMDDICNNGVFKRIVRRGIGEPITENSAVLYNLNAYLEGQDEPFDSTWLRGRPNLHKLSYDTILPGLCIGLLTMRRSERSELIVRPQYAYLEMGCPPRVPENATILYIVEVIKVFEEGSLAHFDSMNPEDRLLVDFKQILALCDAERISGNSYYKFGKYKEAAFRYRRAIRCLEQNSYKTIEEENRAKEILVKLYPNIANTFNKLQKPFNAMSNCKKALSINPNCGKALYQYGLAKMMNGDNDEAKHYFVRALKLKPKSQEINTALIRLDNRMAGDKKLIDALYKNMGSVFKSHPKE